jgi:hypothetical protein
MLALPRTLCPDCGTECIARLCPSCRFEIWMRVYWFLDPEGEETVATRVGLIVRQGPDLDESGNWLVRLLSTRDESGASIDPTPGFDGLPVRPIRGGFAWERYDRQELIPESELEDLQAATDGKTWFYSSQSALAEAMFLTSNYTNLMERLRLNKTLQDCEKLPDGRFKYTFHPDYMTSDEFKDVRARLSEIKASKPKRGSRKP